MFPEFNAPLLLCLLFLSSVIFILLAFLQSYFCVLALQPHFFFIKRNSKKKTILRIHETLRQSFSFLKLLMFFAKTFAEARKGQVVFVLSQFVVFGLRTAKAESKEKYDA